MTRIVVAIPNATTAAHKPIITHSPPCPTKDTTTAAARSTSSSATNSHLSSESPRLTGPLRSAISCRSIHSLCFGSANFPGQFSDDAQLLLALALVGHDRPHDQRVDPRVAERADLLFRLVAWADDRDQVDQLVGQCEHRLGLLSRQVQLLHVLSGLFEPIRRYEAVVEVLLARAHAADVEREDRTHRVSGALHIVADHDVDRGTDHEIVERPASAGGTLL